MKTRRILAASTAALLAFGSVAVVASAAAATNEYKGVTVTWDSSAAATASTTADQAKGFVTSVQGQNKLDDDTWAAEAALAAAKYTVEATKTSAAWTVTVKPADGVTGFGAISKSFTIEYDGAAADLGASEGGALDLGYGVTASVDKKGASKTFKDYNIAVAPVAVDSVGSGDDATVDYDKTAVIKDLKDSIKEQFEDVNPDNVEILDITLSSKGVVKSKAPATVTIKVETDFEPTYVYHVVDDEIEIVTGAKSEKLTNGNYRTTFTTTKFSPFILMKGDKLKGAGVTTEDKDPEAVNGTSSAAASNASAATSNAGTTTNPDTGIALAIAPVVLAAGAVAVVALKKKH
ncbi:MAG: hypothetical protein K2J77_00870 [Oscillospiraceae bacterium]|nr:hypothetical protein [Oscillospiraceae bacterium]